MPKPVTAVPLLLNPGVSVPSPKYSASPLICRDHVSAGQRVAVLVSVPAGHGAAPWGPRGQNPSTPRENRSCPT